MKLFLRRMGRRHSTNGVGSLPNVHPGLPDQDYVPGDSISVRYLTAPEMMAIGMCQASFAPDARTGDYILERGMSVRSDDSSASILGAMERQVSMPDGCLHPPPYTAPQLQLVASLATNRSASRAFRSCRRDRCRRRTSPSKR